MVNLYRFLRKHKWLMYSLLIVSTIVFALLGLRCQFEENIARLLPPIGDNMTVDLAFSDLKVKDKVFIQVLSTLSEQDSATIADNRSTLADAMDFFMQRVEELDDQHIDNLLYEFDLAELLSIAPVLLDVAPTYLDFTDCAMDSLMTIEHLTAQIAAYKELLDTDLGEQLYDIIGYDPAGIVMSKVSQLGATTDSQMPAMSRINNSHLFSADGTVCQGFINPHLSSMDSGSAGKLLRAIKKAKAETESEFGQVEVLYHGTVIQSANNAGRIKKDLLYTIGAALIIILILLGWCFRQPSTNFIILLPILYGAIFALSGMYIFRGGMSVMALGIGAIVLGVALSYCLHVMIHFKYVGNASQTVAEQAKPVCLGALTTIGAFAGLLFTSSSLLQDFGLFAVFAMIGTTAASLIFMPHFFPRKNVKNERAFRFLERVNDYEIDRKNWLLLLMAVYVIATMSFAGKVKFDPNLKNINYTAPEVLRSQKLWAEKNNDGFFQQYYAAVAPTLDEALQAMLIVENAADSLKQAGSIHSYTKVSSLMPSTEKQTERIEHWQTYFNPDKQKVVQRNINTACAKNDIDPDLFAPFTALMQGEIEPMLLAKEGLISDALLSNLVEQVGDNYLVFIPVKLPQEKVNEVNDVLTKLPSCLVLDPFYYTIDTVQMMNDDFNTILGISALFVLVVLIISLRRLSLAIIAFLPMALSWYVVLGAMAITGQEFNLINIVVSSFIFGIGVDYSIFIMDGLLAKARGENPKLLAYHKTAITISATILVICMFSLLFAVHPAMKSIGFASLVGMITTMLLSYTLEPWLFRQCLRWKWLRNRILK